MSCNTCARLRAHLPAGVRAHLEQTERWFAERRRERKAQKRAQKALLRAPETAGRETIGASRETPH